MSINYVELSKRNCIVNRYAETACYFKIFTRGVEKRTKEIVCYQKKINVNNEQAAKWVEEINSLGFPCEYLGTENIPEKYAKVKIPEGYHVFIVKVAKYEYINHMASTLTLLRYLYEYPFEEIVRDYLSYRIKYPTKNKFKLLQLAFLATRRGNGHTLHQRGNGVFATKTEILNSLKQGNSIYLGGTSLHARWDIKSPRAIQIDRENPLKTYKKMNNKKLKIHVVGGTNYYANWLTDYEPTKKLEDADLVMFTGGEDVHPSLYHEEVGKYTYTNLQRDLEEKKSYEKARALKLPMIGICRGAQFLCVMNGGKLVQHQENPSFIHDIECGFYGNIKITSTHHQAMYPFNLNKYTYSIIGYTKGLSKTHLNGKNEEMDVPSECEIVQFYDTNCLCIQGHPEDSMYQREYPESLKTLQRIVKDTIINRYN